jgi:2-haloalkanoic acid dehalogenase type II
MMFENISGIIFDLDGTLTDYQSGSDAGLREALKVLNEEEEKPVHWDMFQEAYHAVIHAESAWSSVSGFTQSAKDNRSRRFQLLLQGLGRPATIPVLLKMAEAYGHGRSSGTKLYPDVIETLTYLKKKYALAILSEGDEKTQMDQISDLKIHDYFSNIVISDKTPWHKPNVTLFNFTALEMKLDPEKIIMVGDRLDWDIRPAGEIGMKTIWLNRSGSDNSYESSSIQPDAVIRNLDELRKIL